MGPWFGVIAGGTEFNFKHRLAHTKINAKQRDKKGFITTSAFYGFVFDTSNMVTNR